MNIDRALKEMATELVPHLSSREDFTAIKELKKLYKKDPIEFNKKLKRINMIRRSEKLPELDKNEILGKTLEIDIKGKSKIEKAKEKQENFERSRKINDYFLYEIPERIKKAIDPSIFREVEKKAKDKRNIKLYEIDINGNKAYAFYLDYFNVNVDLKLLQVFSPMFNFTKRGNSVIFPREKLIFDPNSTSILKKMLRRL